MPQTWEAKRGKENGGSEAYLKEDLMFTLYTSMRLCF